MYEGIVIGLLVLVALSMAGMAYAIYTMATMTKEQTRASANLVSKMSDQVVANSDFQLDRLKIAAHADVSKDYISRVAAPAASHVPTVNGTFPPTEDPDYITEQR
jgi:hypothetical protein